VCGASCPASAAACARCLAAVAPRRAGSGRVGELRVVWGAVYEGRARELVAALKFHGRLDLARLAGGVVAATAAGAGLDCGRAVVPVPAAPLRLRRRGFDPGELIAAAVAGELGLPLVPCLARRSGRRQVGRDRAARLVDPPRVRLAGKPPRAALLVDDVLTTGATLGSCAAVLRRAGCPNVAAGVFARTLDVATSEAYDLTQR
jgi:predicted amidophosphoribosyltransferase